MGLTGRVLAAKCERKENAIHTHSPIDADEAATGHAALRVHLHRTSGSGNTIVANYELSHVRPVLIGYWGNGFAGRLRIAGKAVFKLVVLRKRLEPCHCAKSRAPHYQSITHT